MAMRKAHYDSGGNNVQKQGPTDVLMTQRKPVTNVVAGASNLTMDSILAGILDRTGPGAGFIDTFPAALTVIQAIPELSDGDSFEFTYRNGVAFAMTAALASANDVLVNANVAASAIRQYLVTLLAGGIGGVLPVSTTNASAQLVITPPTLLDPVVGQGVNYNGARFRVGQSITGAGIQAGTTVLAINYTGGTITMSQTATATASNIAATLTPRVEYRGLWSATA